MQARVGDVQRGGALFPRGSPRRIVEPRWPDVQASSRNHQPRALRREKGILGPALSIALTATSVAGVTGEPIRSNARARRPSGAGFPACRPAA
jgi:hypothetical protein